jgi:hypothetical protein
MAPVGPIPPPVGLAVVEAPPPPPPAPPEPPVDGRADWIWASILMGAPGTKNELENAMLRGSVMVHQDPKPGALFPTEASGEAIDLTGQGKGLMEFKVQREAPPQAFDPKTKLASRANGRRENQTALARVEFQGKVVEGENIIGLNQKLNFAWVEGPGVYSQLTDRGLLDDKGVANETDKNNPKSSGPGPKDKLVIYWNDRMQFIGASRDLDGRPAAKIEFRGTSRDVRTPSGKTEFRRGVDARMTESHLVADWMDVYMDKTINLAKDTKQGPKKADEPVEPDPQIAMIECRGKNILENSKLKSPGVVVINEKTIPGSKDLKEKQRIEGEWIVFDKRTGEFEAPGPGTTWLYQREAGEDLQLMPPMNDLKSLPQEGKKQVFIAPVRRVLHFRMFDADGNMVADTDERSLPGKAQQIEDLKRRLNGLWPPHELIPDEKARLLPLVKSILGQSRELAKAALPPLKLTKVKYVEGMQGRFGVARDKADNKEREALFLGSAQAANATVLTGNGDIDFDAPRAKDYVFLTSDEIHVFTEPAQLGSKEGTRQLLNARGNGAARTIDSLITADRITYDSASELMYAYGEDDKEVALVRQEAEGQPWTAGRGKSLRFNKKTHESDFTDPQSIVFTDLKSGFRPKPYFPELGGSGQPTKAPKQTRLPFMRTQRSATERKGFSGQ